MRPIRGLERAGLLQVLVWAGALCVFACVCVCVCVCVWIVCRFCEVMSEKKDQEIHYFYFGVPTLLEAG